VSGTKAETVARGWRAYAAALTACIAALALLAPGARAAAVFTVDSTDDAGDANTGDTTCATAGNVCTLRAAIQQTNAQAGGDVINFSVTGQITLGSALPQVDQDLTITGPGANQLTVSGANSHPVFELGFVTARMSGLTVANGQAPAGMGAYGAGITSSANLTLDRVVVRNNTAAASGPSGNIVVAAGGGILLNNGSLTLRQSTVRDNHARATVTGTGEARVEGGGIRVVEGADLEVDQSTISGNDATATISSGVNPADAEAKGGGIYNDGDVTLDRSTISTNSALAKGGVASLLSSYSNGGGIYEDNGTTLSATSVTFEANSAKASGQDPVSTGANLSPFTGTEPLRNTILADPKGAQNCYRGATSLGYNMDDDGTCGLGSSPGDKPDVADAGVDPALANNGGPTQTHALLVGSPAVDKGRSFGATTDQRGPGFPRIIDSPFIANAPGGDGADMGAFERDSIPPETSIDDKTINRGAQRARFSFSSPDGEATFQCRLDHKRFRSCSSPKTYEGLGSGRHRFKVRARDAAGNVDPTPARARFRI
jgi:CSLREA domain-containing protein